MLKATETRSCSPGNSWGAGAAPTARPAVASAPARGGGPAYRWAGPGHPCTARTKRPLPLPQPDPPVGGPAPPKFPWGRQRGGSATRPGPAPPNPRATRYPWSGRHRLRDPDAAAGWSSRCSSEWPTAWGRSSAAPPRASATSSPGSKCRCLPAPSPPAPHGSAPRPPGSHRPPRAARLRLGLPRRGPGRRGGAEGGARARAALPAEPGALCGGAMLLRTVRGDRGALRPEGGGLGGGPGSPFRGCHGASSPTRSPLRSRGTPASWRMPCRGHRSRAAPAVGFTAAGSGPRRGAVSSAGRKGCPGLGEKWGGGGVSAFLFPSRSKPKAWTRSCFDI